MNRFNGVCDCCINSEKSIFEDGNDCMFCGECHDKFKSKYSDEDISNMVQTISKQCNDIKTIVQESITKIDFVKTLENIRDYCIKKIKEILDE